MNELERKPHSSDSMRVRCPHCRKLYLVQYLDIKEAKPRFECIQCHSRFWLSMTDMDLNSEITGIPIQVKENPLPPKPKRVDGRTESCPKCFKMVTVGATECPHCRVVISKFKELNFDEVLPPHSEALAKAWNKVVNNYASDSAHADFMRAAQKERNLPFAAAQYGQMNKLMPGDETTEKRLREIQSLGSVMLPASEKKSTRNPYARLWQIPLAASVLMMAVGLIIPMFRNIVGVGAAFLFLALAIQIQLRRKT